MKVKKKKTKKINPDYDKLVLGVLGGEFEKSLMVETPIDDVPYYIPFKHVGLQTITGGLPGGILCVIDGDSQAGKSFLMYELGLQAMRMGGWYLQNDIERSYNTKFGQRLGLESCKRFVKSKATELQKLISEHKKFVIAIRKHDKDCPIIIGTDSYPPIQIKATQKELNEQCNGKDPKELKGYLTAKKNAVLAQLIGEYTTFLHDNKVTWILLNQTREKIGLVFGDKTTSNAENILSFYATLRLRGRVSKKLKHPKLENKNIGRQTIWETIKNRNVEPFMKVRADIIFKTGLRPYSGLIDLLINEGKIEKTKVKGKIKYKYKKVIFGAGALEKLIAKYPDVLQIGL